MGKNILSTSHLSKKFKDFTALDDVTINLEKGKIYGLIGKNVLRYEQKTGSLFRYL